MILPVDLVTVFFVVLGTLGVRLIWAATRREITKDDVSEACLKSYDEGFRDGYSLGERQMRQEVKHAFEEGRSLSRYFNEDGQ